MDNIMIGDLVVLIQDVQHDWLGVMPCYTMACALYRTSPDTDTWLLGVEGFGAVEVSRSAFRLYEEKSVIRYDRAQKRDAHQAGADVDEWHNPF